MLWLNFEIPKLLKSFNIDIFWGTLQLLPMFKQPIPCVVNYHDLNFVSAPKTMHKANYWQHKFLSRFTLTNADKIFCLSENTKNEIQAYRPWIKDKLKVVYPGVTKNSDTTIGNSYNKYLFTIGTLEPRKNLQTLLNAYLNIKKDNPDYPYSLVMAGRLGWGEATLTEKLRNGAYKEQGVEFIENPDEKNLISLYKNCVAFLFSSKHEGFGLPLLEAMAEDKICIASDIPVFREILDVQKDILVPPMDIKAWENALNEIGKRSRNDLQRTFDMNKWSWKNTSNLIEEELISLTKKN
jgi:glycosyltransferase involved in cell wall biosynthesis